MEPITALLYALGSLFGNRIMDWFKSWTWITEEEKSKLSGPLADAVAWVIPAVIGLLLTWIAQTVGLLDHLTVTDLAGNVGWPVFGAQLLFLIRKAIGYLKSR